MTDIVIHVLMMFLIGLLAGRVYRNERLLGKLLRNDMVAGTLRARPQQLAENVTAHNALLRRLNREYDETHPKPEPPPWVLP